MIEGLFQPMHLIIILAIVLVVFGPGKLANVGGAMGKSIKEFKAQSTEPESNAETKPIQVSASANSAATAEREQQKAAASDPTYV